MPLTLFSPEPRHQPSDEPAPAAHPLHATLGPPLPRCYHLPPVALVASALLPPATRVLLRRRPIPLHTIDLLRSCHMVRHRCCVAATAGHRLGQATPRQVPSTVWPLMQSATAMSLGQ
jgi:hypothetical protein